MKTDELREKYLSFFESKGCSRQPSDVLVPTWDPSVLFTPAGMNQFKDHFLGKVALDYTRATTCQKCLRTGDIDNVGRTAFHHTFFEMLGNFSFGDYFKTETIQWAWEFLTDERWLGIDPGRLNVTVYKDDAEAAEIWRTKIGLPSSRITPMEEDENFWPASAPSQGPDGVCGPCSEIYYVLDDGSDVEIWNLVFTQFNRVGTPPDNLRPLPSKNIDTGMGLERTASVLQGLPTNYHIDNLLPIVHAAGEVVGRAYEYEGEDGRRLRRITDHVRAATFAIHENVYPGANAAKYVIRRLIRRAVLDGHQMGQRQPFLYHLVGAVVDAMATPYPELRETSERVQGVIRSEEERFLATIDAGLLRIDGMFGDMKASQSVTIDGEKAAEFYTSFGVPPELVQQMGAERGYTFDWSAYRQAMTRHAEVSGGDQFKLFQTGPLESLKESLRRTEFCGYEEMSCDAVIKGIVTDDGRDDDHQGQLVTEAVAGVEGGRCRIVLDQTPFYGESGGQVGDAGRIFGDGFAFEVEDTQKHGDLTVHVGRVTEGTITEGSACRAEVQTSRRDAIRRAHSATHILHYALQKNLGSHAQQQGSKVEPDWLRFDFSNQEPIAASTLAEIRRDVLEQVEACKQVSWKTVSLAEARETGAMMLFGEKYPDPVRMVSMGDFSNELCGGTHLDSTGDVQSFELIGEESVSAGTRRVIAVTGPRADRYRSETVATVVSAARTLGCSCDGLPAATLGLVQSVRSLKKELQSGKASDHPESLVGSASPQEPTFEAARDLLRETARTLNVGGCDVVDRIAALLDDRLNLAAEAARMTAGGQVSADDLIAGGLRVDDTLVIVAETPGANPNMMRGWIDQIRKKSDTPTAVLLAATQGSKLLFVGGLSKALVERGLKAGEWVGGTAKITGGGGGGRPDMAQAGGKDVAKLAEALQFAKDSIRESLG